MKFEIGEQIDCLDQVGKWYVSTILNTSETQIKVHYEGWSDQYDEWLDKTSDRIAELNVKSNGAKGGSSLLQASDSQSSKETVAKRRWKLLVRTLNGKVSTDSDAVRKSRVRFDFFQAQKLENPSSWIMSAVTIPDSSFEEVRYEDIQYEIIPSKVSVVLRQRIENDFMKRDLEISSKHRIDNTGLVCLWPTEEVLTYYCLKNSHMFYGKRVCELGAGFGLAGIALAAVCRYEQSPLQSMLVTDGNPQAAAFIQHTARFNFPDSNDVQGDQLYWAKNLEAVQFGGHFDLIIGSDCTFFRDFHHELHDTVYSLLDKNGTAYLLNPQRGGTLREFVDIVNKYDVMDVELIERYNDEVWSRHHALLAKASQDPTCKYNTDTNYPYLLKLSHKVRSDSA